MAVSLLDVLVSGRPDRSPLDVRLARATGALLAAAVILSCAVGRRARDRR